MKPRTEEEMISNAPLKVKFGVATYEIKPLTINKSQVWRNQLCAIIDGSVAPGLKAPITTPLPTIIAASTAPGIRDVPLHIAELVFAYAPELPKEQIMETATDTQLVDAFHGIMRMSFPYLPFLGFISEILNGKVPQQAL